MKVLIVAGWYPSKFNPKSGDFVMYQTRALVSSGIQAAVIFAHLNHQLLFQPKEMIHKYSFDIEEGIPTFRLSGFFPPKINPFFLNLWAKRFESLFLKYKKKYGLPDILHAHTFVGGLVAMRISRQYNIPYLITEHQTPILTDDIPRWWIPLMKNVYENAALTIAVSRALKDKIELNYVDSEVAVVPNFIDTELFNLAPQQHSGFNFIAVGDLIPRKGFEMLIKAYKLMVNELNQETSLTIIGDGPDVEQIKRLITSLGLVQRVHLPGRCSQEVVADYLKKSDVFVLSSKVETFGIVVVEAMACGIPVITTRCYGPLDIVTEATGVLIPVNDIVALKNAMIHMYHHKNEYNGIKIRKYAVENFGNVAGTKKLKGIYEAVLILSNNERE